MIRCNTDADSHLPDYVAIFFRKAGSSGYESDVAKWGEISLQAVVAIWS